MPTLLQLSQSYQNPESVNYRLAYLREQMEQQLLNLGDLAYEDQVQLAMLGETIIVGGYLRTELLAAKSIQAKHLAVEDLAAISAKFTGDVYIGGDVVVGGQGVLSAFQFVSNGHNEGWGNFGIMAIGGEVSKGRVSVPVSIPANFSITKATIELQAMPAYVNNTIDDSNNRWRQSRNLKLYHSPGNEGCYEYLYPGGVLSPFWRSGTDITSAVLGVSTWSPPLQYSGTDPANTSNKIQYRSGSILDYLAPGQTTVFYVETTDSPSVSPQINAGLGRLVVSVEGYARPE